MRRYETIFIVKPNVAEDEIEAITSKATSIIEGDGGTILRINNWGLKKLAYLIKKENQGYYVYADYAGVPASVAEIERIFRIDDRILKYLTVKLSDSCDPEAVKEELAKAEPVPTSDEEGMEEEKDDKHKEQEKTDRVKEELTKAEPVPVSDKEVTGEGKDDEHEEQEEPDTVKEEQAD